MYFIHKKPITHYYVLRHSCHISASTNCIIFFSYLLINHKFKGKESEFSLTYDQGKQVLPIKSARQVEKKKSEDSINNTYFLER